MLTKKKVLIVGAGAAGMSTAHHLVQHPDKFDVTLIDSSSYCGGQAFSVKIDESKYQANWLNQGVQGGSFIFHHTLKMFADQGHHSDPVRLQVSFGKGETFWTNVFPTRLLEKHAKEIKRFLILIKIVRWFELFFGMIPIHFLMRIFLFSDEFTYTIAFPMLALFLGTGNATPEVPSIILERLCTAPTYGMWYPLDKTHVTCALSSMVVFPNFSVFYEDWRKDLVKKGVNIRLSTECTAILKRNKSGVEVILSQKYNTTENGSQVLNTEEAYDEIVICVLADAAKKLLSKTASWKERRVLGRVKFSDDITITHNDSEYMKRNYENFYSPEQAIDDQSTVDQPTVSRPDFKPMYYIKQYEADPSKLEMCFDCTNYQAQFPASVPFENHVFQTIFLNKDRDSHLWSDQEIDESKIIRKDWWHQICHSWTHYLFVVPWIMFLQGKKHTRFAGSWTLINAHEVAVLSGISAAVNLGADYPAELQRDAFAFLCFRLYYLLIYGKWYRKRDAGKGEGENWGRGDYGQIYQGPGVSQNERTIHREEMESQAGGPIP